MRVILNKEVKNLGEAGEIVNVAPGYGRNYLIPQGLAIPASKGSVQQAAQLRQGVGGPHRGDRGVHSP